MGSTAGGVFTKASLLDRYRKRTSKFKTNGKSRYFGRALRNKEYFAKPDTNYLPVGNVISQEIPTEQTTAPSTLQVPWLRSALLDLNSGNYQHGACRPTEVLIGKKKRVLDRIRFNDKWIQGIAADAAAAHIDKSLYDGVHGFRPKRSCHTALRHVVQILKETGSRYVARLDISKFYDNIPLGLLREKVDKAGFPNELTIFLRGTLDTAVRTWHGDKGLPTGWPINPTLANLFLRDSDREIERLAPLFVRYADDYFVPVRSFEEGQRLLRVVTEILGNLGLVPSEDKTEPNFLAGNSETILPFLGHLISMRADSTAGNPIRITPHFTAIGKIQSTIDAAISEYTADEYKDSGEFLREVSLYLKGVSGYYSTYNKGWGLDREGAAIDTLNIGLRSYLLQHFSAVSINELAFRPRPLRK